MKENKSYSDMIAGIVLLVCSLVIIMVSLKMPQHSDWGFYASPALSPLIFSVLLAFLGLMIFIRSLKEGSWSNFRESRHNGRKGISIYLIQVLIVLGLIIVYLILLGRLHFILISALFIVTIATIFKGTNLFKATMLGVLSSGSIWAVFTYVFNVPLP